MGPLERLIALAVLASLASAAPLQAQFGKKLSERIKQNAEQRKRQTEEHLVAKAAEPADSAMERIAAPVDSAAARAGGKAGKAVANAGRGPAAAEEARIREALAAGQADLADVAFEQGGDAISDESSTTLTALAKVLAGSPGMYLVQGRADAGMKDTKAKRLADGRAASLKQWLLEHGVPDGQLFAAGDGVAVPDGPLATVVRMQ